MAEVLNLALRHHQAGRLQEAEEIYRKILQKQPHHPDALHLLGVIAHQQGKNDVAIEYFREAIKANPSVAEYQNSIGEACRVLGRFEEALSHYRQALTLNPSYAEPHSNLGIVLRWQGKLDEASAHCRQALSLKPSLVEAHNNLGNTLRDQGKLDEAIGCYRQALALRPRYVDVMTNLATVLRAQGRTLDAVEVLLNGLAAQPTNVRLCGSLAETLRGFSLETCSPTVHAILVSLCGDDNISKEDITVAVIGLLKNLPAFPCLLHAADCGSDPFSLTALEADAFTREPLLLTALPRIVIADAVLERVLTHMRRCLLLRTVVKKGLAVPDDSISHDFVCALARQCFYAEYPFFVAEDEARQASALRAGLQAALQDPAVSPRNLERSLALVALYDSLHRLTGWERLLEPMPSQWSEAFRTVLLEQLVNSRREREIASQLTAITDIDDEISQAVRMQYEENPYPLWMSIHNRPAITLEEHALTLRPGEDIRVYPRPTPILVAGCGSGRHPIQVARSFRECEVLAVDLSRASLAYAVRMAEQFGVTNITFHQADILKLGKLERRFALIECVGVLHHLRDPLAGWQVLVGLLQPDGLMKIGLYSEKARRCIGAAREFVRSKGFEPTPDGIRNCRLAIANLPDGHPAREAMIFKDGALNSQVQHFWRTMLHGKNLHAVES